MDSFNSSQMTTILAHFDGKAFVPEQPVNLPIGAQVAVSIPAHGQELRSSPSFTPEEDRDWQNILAQIRSGEPTPATLDEAMREIRMRP